MAAKQHQLNEIKNLKKPLFYKSYSMPYQTDARIYR